MRFPSIDVLRGLAILLMIQVHFVDNLCARPADDTWLYDVSAWLGMLPAPLFTFLTGVSYCLWLRKQEAAGRPDASITKVTLRRGVFLFGAGIAFNVLVWLPEDTFDWDILTLIGTALVLLAFARKVPPEVLVLICVMIALLSPLLRVATDYPAYWLDETYDYDFTLMDVVFGFFANGHFPLLPWLIFPFMGFLVGEALFAKAKHATPRPRWLLNSAVALMSLAGLSLIVHARLPAVLGKYVLTGFTMFPASTEYVAGMLGLCVAALMLLHWGIDRRAGGAATGRCLTFLRLFSTYSLTIYVVHHMLHIWPLWIYGAWIMNEPTYYWRQAISPALALSLACACAVTCYLLVLFLERHGGGGLESLMRWLCDE